MILARDELRNLMDLKIFLDTDSDIMLSWKIYQKTQEGENLEDIIEEYMTYDKPFYEKFVNS